MVRIGNNGQFGSVNWHYFGINANADAINDFGDMDGADDVPDLLDDDCYIPAGMNNIFLMLWKMVMFLRV